MGKVTIRFFDELNWQTALPGSFALSGDDVHVYRIGISHNLTNLDAFTSTLTAGEKERGGKYLQLKDRQRFVVSRGAQRYILGRYLGLPAAEVSFAPGANKKPYVVNSGGGDIQYNITHAGDCILLAVANKTVGSDVEFIDEAFEFRDIVAEHFAEDEMQFINCNNSTENFYLLWTRKEALLKATGQGLGEHLIVTPSLNGEHILLNNLWGANADWQVCSFNLPQKHIGSVASSGTVTQYYFFDIQF